MDPESDSNKEYYSLSNIIKRESDNYSNNDNNIEDQNENNDLNEFENRKLPINNFFNLEILLNNNKKEILKIDLNEDVNAKIDSFCKEKNFTKKEKELISELIIEKKNELIKQYENKNKYDNIKNNYIYNNNNKKKQEISNRKLIRNKSFDAPIKKRKFLKKNGDLIGQELYNKGIKFKLLKEKKLKQKRIQNSELSQDITFHPQISEKSKQLTKNINKNIKIEDRLLALGKEREKKLLKKIAEKSFIENNKYNLNTSNNNDSDEIDNGDYYFHPKINKYPLTRNKSEDIFTKLHNEANVYKSHIDKLNKKYYIENCPFKPEITKKAKNMNDTQYKKVMNRFYDKMKKKKDDILNEYSFKAKLNKNYNVKPRIDNGKNKNINTQKSFQRNKNKEINENLDDDFIEKKINNKKYNEEIKNDWNKYSKNIIKRIKEVKFREIFNLLDKNKSNYISYSNISYIDIPPNIMIALTPLINEININKFKKIYFEEFKELTNEPLTSLMMKEE